MLAELAELRRRVQQNDDEIDAMQIAAAQAQGRGAWWLRQPAVLSRPRRRSDSTGPVR